MDGIYNSAVDRKFEQEHGTLAEVLAVSMADLKKYDWQDYLKEEAEEARLEEYLRQMQNQLTSLSEEEEQERKKPGAEWCSWMKRLWKKCIPIWN